MNLRFSALLLALLPTLLAGQTPQPEATPEQKQAAAAMPFRDATLPIEQRVDDLVRRLTLEEKVAQTIDRAAAIPRLDIPAYNWWNEGLHGIARSGFATMFPQAIGNAATWDAPLVHEIGAVVSTEARAKYNDALRHNNHDRYYGLTIWSPNINIFRDPRWGRGQETYGEDPFLTATLGTAFVRGIQGDDPKYFRAIATPKHYAVHSGPESTRHEANVDPSEHDLWDTYLPAFRATITQGHADSIMCAYNRIDKAPACGSQMLLGEILRKDWKFEGYVTSDCDAVDDFSQPHGHHYAPDNEHGSALAVQAGTDLDCGTAYKSLTAAVQQKLLPEEDLNTTVKRLFTARMRLGMFDPAEKVPFSSIPFSEVNSQANADLALRAARESMVLLKNEQQVLPLKAGQTVAVVGPLAASLVALEGNYNAIPLHPVLPIDGIEREFGADHVIYAQGSAYVENGEVPVPRTLLRVGSGSGEQGLKGEYFAQPNFDGSPEVVRTDKEIDFDWSSANPVPSFAADTTNQAFAVRWSGMIAVPAPGSYEFQLRLPRCGTCDGKVAVAFFLDGKVLESAAPPTDAMGKLPPSGRNFGGIQRYTVSFTDSQPHPIRIEYRQTGQIQGAMVSLEWTPRPQQLLEEAGAAARKADVVVAFVGLTPRLEGEEMRVNAKGFAGGDRTSIDLPDVQQALLETVAKAGKPMVVVLLNGSALAVNWAKEHARGILEAWYPGQAGGQAIAETLSGKNNPAGRLPVTFYTGVDQLPPFEDYSMANRTYRYFKGKPLFGFGDGLSYTEFAYKGLKLSSSTLRAGEPLTVEADVTNAGPVEGDEVAELYLAPPRTALSPTLALAGFERVHLRAGETKHVRFQLDPRTLSEVDEKGNRGVTAGSYRISLGGSQPTGDAGKGVVSEGFSIEGNQVLPK
ncbi:glycoside hydrolase family 3 protein [Acidobacteria bacterium AB60]|nr:glycoside hydrolase family 3 protein [Acidobacteria bacterium AB60]